MLRMTVQLTMAPPCRRDTSEESEGGEASGSSPTAGQRAGRPKTLRKTPSSRSRHKRPPVRAAAFEVPHHHSLPSAPLSSSLLHTVLPQHSCRQSLEPCLLSITGDDLLRMPLLRGLRPGLSDRRWIRHHF